jgi:hypothetical protein
MLKNLGSAPQPCQFYVGFSQRRSMLKTMMFHVKFLIYLGTVGQDVTRVFIFPLPASGRHSNIRLLPFVTITTAVFQLED